LPTQVMFEVGKSSPFDTHKLTVLQCLMQMNRFIPISDNFSTMGDWILPCPLTEPKQYHYNCSGDSDVM
jgi:hypothetical protein